MARIWHVIGGSSIGGGTYVVRKLAGSLLQHGHAVTIVSSDPATAELFHAMGCAVVSDIPFAREIRPASDCAGTVRLAARLKRLGCDLLHTHTSKGGVVGRAAGCLAGVSRIVHHVHGFAFHPTFTPARTLRFYAAIERLAAALCDAMIFVNSSDLELARSLKIVSIGPLCRVVSNGVDLPELTDSCVNRSEDRIRIAFVGRLSRQKGVDLLIDAAARLSRPADVQIIGDGPLRTELEARAASKASQVRWNFLGHRSDVPELLSQADIVVLPSRWEGHSIAVLEAMATGRPVITTSIKGNIETIDHGVDGYLAPPENADELRSAMDLLAGDPGLRARLGEAAREKVAASFHTTGMVEKVFGIYQALGLPVGRAA